MNKGFSYSGRGMFGQRCLAFRSLLALIEAAREDPTLPAEGWCMDNSLRGVVIYNPRVPPPSYDTEV